ncbi:MAG: hypothetical protein Kow0077_25790 [Anaerolineae bacterium]
MISRLRRYFNRLVELFPDPIALQQARLLAGLSMLVIVLSVVGFSASIVLPQSVSYVVFVRYFSLLTSILSVSFLLLLRRGNLRIVSAAVFALTVVVSLAVFLVLDPMSYLAVLVVIPVLLGGALYGALGVALGGVLVGVALIMRVAGETVGVFSSLMTASLESLASVLTIGIALGYVAFVLWFTLGSSRADLLRLRDRSVRLDAIQRILAFANRILGEPDFLQEVVNTIQKEMNLYHVQIFLLDARRENAVLAASTGELGEQLLARGHQLPVGSRSVIGQVTMLGQMVYAEDTAATSVHRSNEVLALTRSEIAFPLMAGDRVIGALDIQSTRPRAFTPQDIAAFEVLAEQISAVVHNHQMVEAQRERMQRLEAENAETRQTLTQTERVNRLLTRQAWEDYLAGEERTPGLRVENGQVEVLRDWTPAMRDAALQDRPVVLVDGDRQTLIMAVPIEVRGQTLGALEVALPQHASIDDARELVNAVANRLALALDNTRLLEEASSRAAQEHRIGQIASELQSTVEIEEMLQIVIRELQAAMGASRSSIRLRSLTATPGPAASQQ